MICQNIFDMPEVSKHQGTVRSTAVSGIGNGTADDASDMTADRVADAASDAAENAPASKSNTDSDSIRDYGQVTLTHNSHKIHLLSIIGEIEGHDLLPAGSKSTKYEHILPQLAAVENSCEIEGLLILLHTMGGDVESGLAIAEMIASMKKPSVSLVLGGSHSIGVPLTVASDYSFIVPTGTMILHPVRMSGTVIGAPQTYEYFDLIQDRIVSFIASHSDVPSEEIKQMMLATGTFSKDLGTILVGEQAVSRGLVDAVGGLADAFCKLNELIDQQNC